MKPLPLPVICLIIVLVFWAGVVTGLEFGDVLTKW